VDDLRKYLDPKTLAKLEGLELKARLVVEGYVAGLHKSPYHGFSVEFAEHREYVPGDDIKHVDWKVWGRTDKWYLKQYEEETNLVTYLLLDRSESMRFGSDGLTKFDYGRFVAAAIAYLILRQQDSVGLALFDNQVYQYIQPSSQPSHLKQLLHLLDITSTEGQSRIEAVFHDLAERFKKRGLVVVISDLFDDVTGILAGLKHFRHRGHEVIIFHILDRAEIELPFDELTLFRGLEEWPEVLSDPRAVRKAYRKEFEKYLRELSAGCRANNADYLMISTDQKLDVVLTAYLARRRQRRNRGAQLYGKRWS